jgi:hypothetical protein
MRLWNKENSEIFKNYVATIGLMLGGLLIATQFLLFEVRQWRDSAGLARMLHRR